MDLRWSVLNPSQNGKKERESGGTEMAGRGIYPKKSIAKLERNRIGKKVFKSNVFCLSKINHIIGWSLCGWLFDGGI